MSEARQRDRRYAHVRSPRLVTDDLNEAERLLQLIRGDAERERRPGQVLERAVDYAFVHDLAYSAGGGGMDKGRSQIEYSNPTRDTAADARKQAMRSNLQEAGSSVRAAVVALRAAHAQLRRAVHHEARYDPVWRATVENNEGAASGDEKESAAAKQRERARKGEL